MRVASMIGLGVGIDYALLIVTRYRHERELAEGTREAVNEQRPSRSRQRAGRCCSPGARSLVSLLGTADAGGVPERIRLRHLDRRAAARSPPRWPLIPALLGLAGDRIDRFALHRRHAATAAGSAPSPVVGRGGSSVTLGSPPGWEQRCCSQPLRWHGCDSTADAGNDERRDDPHRLRPPGRRVRGRVQRPAARRGGRRQGGERRCRRRCGHRWHRRRRTAGAGGYPRRHRRRAVLVPQSVETQRLVHTLRDDTLRERRRGSGVRAHVGGSTSDIDFAQVMGDRLPWFIGGVLVLSFCCSSCSGRCSDCRSRRSC
ncbi:MAG: MMPL family transporter [Ilumatobacteraceae bacterium]